MWELSHSSSGEDQCGGDVEVPFGVVEEKHVKFDLSKRRRKIDGC